MTLKTSHCLLRPFTDDDLENVFRGLSDPAVIRYYGVSYDSLESTKAQIKFFTDLTKNETGIWWAICSPDNQLFYGASGFNDLKKEHKKAEIGFWLLPEYWNKGIMTEVIPAVCQYGFHSLGLHRIEAIVETENGNSSKLLLRHGFLHEGTLRECEIKKGRWISLDMYARLNK